MINLSGGGSRTLCGAEGAASVAAAIGGAGFITMALGVPLAIVGGSGVPREQADASANESRPRALAASATEPSFGLSLGLRAAQIALRF